MTMDEKYRKRRKTDLEGNPPLRSVFSVKTVRNLVKSMLLRNAFVMLWAKPVSGNP